MINYAFKNKDLLSEALTHPSLCNDQNNKGLNYERLEFLGDRVLGLAISEILFKNILILMRAACSHTCQFNKQQMHS